MDSATKSRDAQVHACRKPILWWIAALAVSATLFAVAFWFAGIGFVFVFVPCALALFIWAAELIVRGVISAWRQRHSPPRAVLAGLIPPLVIVLGALAFLPIVWGVSSVMTYAALGVNLAKYERIIGAARTGEIPSNLSGRARQFASDGTEFEYERLLPHRVAFALPGGFISEWDAILYDPVDGKSGSGNTTERIRGQEASDQLFDHWWTIESCTHMVGPYYRCHFS